MHEIITLQVGRQSNYVATHFWNAQESYFTYGQDAPSPVDHDIHWRAGLGADGSETYLPRTVIYDRKGGFGSLRKVNALYDVQEEGTGADQTAATSNLWSATNQPVVHRATPIPPSAYTKALDAGVTPAPLTTSDVRYWSDYSRVYYHPRSLIEVGDEPEAATSADGRPDKELNWFQGESLFTSLDREHDLLDRDLRPFVEEADHMQGIQVLASVDDSWGGFTARYLERMRDEYGKLTVWLWALQEPVARLPREKRLLRLANKARTLAEAYAQASLVIPLAVPAPPRHTVPADLYSPASYWHTSALVATAMETVTLPSRLRAGQAGGDSLTYLTELLNATGKQAVANLQMSAVQPWKEIKEKMKQDKEVEDGYDNEGDGPSEIQLDMDFAPRDEAGGYQMNGHGRRKTRMFGQAVVTRESEQDDDEEDEDEDEENKVDLTHISDRQDLVRRRFALKPVSQRYNIDLAFPLLDSFPHIYQTTPASREAIPVTAALATDSAVADRLKALRTTVVAPRAIGLEDRENLGNELASIADAYHDGWSSGSDEGDDDD